MHESSTSSRAPNNGGHQCLDLCHAMSSARTSLTQCHKECLLAPLSGQLKHVNIILCIYHLYQYQCSLFTTSKSRKMVVPLKTWSRVEVCLVIDCLLAEVTTANEFHWEFVSVYGEYAMSMKQVSFWCDEKLKWSVVVLHYNSVWVVAVQLVGAVGASTPQLRLGLLQLSFVWTFKTAHFWRALQQKCGCSTWSVSLTIMIGSRFLLQGQIP
jgi:hypothetical protein